MAAVHCVPHVFSLHRLNTLRFDRNTVDSRLQMEMTSFHDILANLMNPPPSNQSTTRSVHPTRNLIIVQSQQEWHNQKISKRFDQNQYCTISNCQFCFHLPVWHDTQVNGTSFCTVRCNYMINFCNPAVCLTDNCHYTTSLFCGLTEQ